MAALSPFTLLLKGKSNIICVMENILGFPSFVRSLFILKGVVLPKFGFDLLVGWEGISRLLI